MIAFPITYVKLPRRQARFSGLVWTILTVLLIGPLVGPFFSWLGWPILGLLNWPIYLMGENVCPQPDLVFHLWGYPLVVCSRCWSGVFGLWIVALTYGAAADGPFWTAWLRRPELLRVSLALLAFAPWVLDIVAADAGWWASGDGVQLLTGLLGGLGAGALLLPLVARRVAQTDTNTRV